MLLIVHQCFLMMLSRKMIVRKATLQTTNKFFYNKYLQIFHKPIDLLISILGNNNDNGGK